MREYKTKETALNHIRAGENFMTKVFNRFWTDREVCIEAIAHGPAYLDFVKTHNPDIEWDSEFIATAFMRALEVKPTSSFLSALGRYLPPQITDSKAIALRAAEMPYSYFENYMSPNLLLDKEVYRAFKTTIFREGSKSQRLSGLIIGAPDEFIDCLLDSPAAGGCFGTPEYVGKLGKEMAAVCAKEKTFRLAFGGLHDDEEFVLEVLKMAGSETHHLRKECSYRIRKAARNMDLMNYLETAVQAKRLEALLKPKRGDGIVARNKTKI
jgi:hypothetical protein